ncbi:Stp1/IreP family PP2C-type Ser/Thr phosphatase [Anaerococcus sp. AGMB09787]|uniref:Stp1/IreP family PP2C-type Ser/Thr phosphatase n=1 Tax=Anaerococcus sp. AGMB09787 TaxID=2922869 RepID=UPI001FAF6D96|nr:Stp1/IreP family PP2C-type Ser/Thr phosphatase [Anaerococcus sp. AGMB09787]
MKFSTISNIGKHRKLNEDYYGNLEKGDLDFFIVADGMGGHSNGEVASKLASKIYIDFAQNEEIDSYDSYLSFQEEALRRANKEIYNLAASEDGLKMGTTAVCLIIDKKEKKYYISHLGDSRIYIFRDGEIFYKTRDHSLLNDLLDSGSLTEDEAKNFKNKSAITKAVGIEEEISPESCLVDMKENDKLLIFTDGLSNELDDMEIRAVVNENTDVYEISTKLIKLALDKGGHDNITVTTILI